MYSNLVNQLREQNALDKLEDVMNEIPVVRKAMGYPPLVTPTSQIVGTQATLNVLTGQRWKVSYAFATVNADTEVDSGNHRVAFVIKAAPGRRAYVRRINIEGNTKTRDEVIRREFRQFESSWYDGEKIRLSRDRVDRLGFFTDVGVSTAEVPDAPDQVDLVVTVKEKPTGSIQIGAGYSSAELTDRKSVV